MMFYILKCDRETGDVSDMQSLGNKPRITGLKPPEVYDYQTMTSSYNILYIEPYDADWLQMSILDNYRYLPTHNRNTNFS